MTEHKIQKDIVAFLRTVLPYTVRVVAISNKPRSAIQGRLEKSRGAVAGVPDLMLTGSFHGFMEVKKPKGSTTSEAQIEWGEWCTAMQVPHAIVRGVEDVRKTLVEWGLPTREVHR